MKEFQLFHYNSPRDAIKRASWSSIDPDTYFGHDENPITLLFHPSNPIPTVSNERPGWPGRSACALMITET
jgi:hypothetical protein